jgi:hypothetical protein
VGSRTARAFFAAVAAVLLSTNTSLADGGITRAQVAVPQIFRVASISPWTDKDHPFRLKVQITNTTELALENVLVRVSVYSRVLSRSQLRSALDGGTPTESLGSLVKRLDAPVAPGEQRTVTIEKPIAELLGSIAGRGVYPIQVSVEHSRGTSIAYTAVPFFPPGDVEPLNITWILPVMAPTVRALAGVYTQAAIDSLDMAQLAQQMKAVAARAGSNVTLAPDPVLLDTLSDLADGFRLSGPSGPVVERADSTIARAAAAVLDEMRKSAAAAGEIATVPYAPADLAALARGRLQGDALRQITLGRSVTAQLLGRATTLSVLVPPGRALDEASANALSPLGISGLVFDPGLLTQQLVEPFQPQLFGPSRPISFTGGTLKALLPDALLSQRMSGPEQGVLLAQAVIAETASAWFELPSLASERLIVIDSPPGLAPTVLGTMLNGLRTAPWLRMLPASGAFDALPPEGAQLPLPILQRERPFLDAARRARAALSTLSAITVTPPAYIDPLDRSILASESDEWTTAPSIGTAVANDVRNTVDATLSRVRVGAGRRVTLTSQTGSVPVTVINGNTFPVRVRIRVTSPKVGFPQGGSQIRVIQPPNDTLDFKIQARTAGSYPLDVLVETPDGNRVIARGSVVLRSSAVSAFTLLIVAGSTVFLLLAWFRRTRRRDRARNGQEHVAPPADSA